MRRAWIAAILLAASARADVFRVLDDPREAMQARVDLIEQAQHEIHALYFLARDDRVTLSALALLRDARRRGVPSVRLIVDANFHRIPKAMLAHLRDEGVEIRVYHPLTLRHPSWIFRRMHEKVIVVDGARYVAGGRNLAEAYFGLARKNYVDRDVYVHGISASDADRHFENLWASRHVADLSVSVAAEDVRGASGRLDAIRRELECGDFVRLGSGRDWSEGERDDVPVRYLHDPLTPADGPRIGTRLAEILDRAKRTIVIESPYLIPSRSFLHLLEKKAREGVSITVVTNSLRSTDGVLPYAAYLKYRRRLIRAGIDVREFKGPDALHAKTIVIDGRIVLVGSYNVDPRSQNLNTEVMCVAESAAVARAVLESIDIHLENAWVMRVDGPRVPRTIKMWMSKLVLPFLEGQL